MSNESSPKEPTGSEGPAKHEILRSAIAATSWYAACETDHPFWAGPNRNTFAEANTDAKDHDRQKHGGEETAVVLSSGREPSRILHLLKNTPLTATIIALDPQEREPVAVAPACCHESGPSCCVQVGRASDLITKIPIGPSAGAGILAYGVCKLYGESRWVAMVQYYGSVQALLAKGKQCFGPRLESVTWFGYQVLVEAPCLVCTIGGVYC